MAFAVKLPSDGGVLGAHFIITGGTSRRTSVVGNVLTHFSVNNHAADHISIVVGFVIDNSEDLTCTPRLALVRDVTFPKM